MRSPGASARGRALAVAGGGLLWASGAVHLDLYVTGYRRIPIVGNLFLFQVATSVALGIAVVMASRRARSRGRATTLTWLSGAVFALGTVVAYTLSRAIGLFGFQERPTTAGLVAGLLEVGAFVALGALLVPPGRPTSSVSRPLAATTGVVAAALLAAVVVYGHGPSGPPARLASGPVSPSARTVPVVHVRISGYEYHPDRVRARPGEVVAVTNHDPVTHTVTAVPGRVPFGGFDTGYVDPGRTVRIHAPKAPGTYRFYCSIHNFMKGVLVVTR